MKSHLESAKLHRAVALEILANKELTVRTRAEALSMAQTYATLAVADALAALAADGLPGTVGEAIRAV